MRTDIYLFCIQRRILGWSAIYEMEKMLKESGSGLMFDTL